MYNLLRAVALSTKIASQWVVGDFSNESVRTLFQLYRRIVLVVTLPNSSVERYIDMEQLRNTYATYPNRLSVLLQVLGQTELELLSELPGQKIGYAKYNDVYRCGYTVHLAKRGMVLPDEYPKADLPDLQLKRPGFDTDLSLVHSHCLMSVNGFFHQTDTDGTDAFIVDGGITSRYSNIGHVGMTSFLSIGALSKHPVKQANLLPKPDSLTLKSGVLITIPEEVDGKAFFLVLGGYLVFPQDGVFYQVGDHQFMLNLERLPYLERLLESMNYLDLSALRLTPSERNEHTLNVEEVWSDAVIRRYLTLSQSFFVSVNVPELFTAKIFLKQMASPGVFAAYQDPVCPLIAGFGRAAEYWKVHEDGQWAVTVVDSFARNYVFNRQPQNTLTNVTNQLAPDTPFFHSQGFLLEIGTNKD